MSSSYPLYVAGHYPKPAMTTLEMTITIKVTIEEISEDGILLRVRQYDNNGHVTSDNVTNAMGIKDEITIPHTFRVALGNA